MRPIDADALKYRRMDYGGYDDVTDEERKRGILYLLKKDVDAVQTIDTVKHGKWIPKTLYPLSFSDGECKDCVQCSNCKTHWDAETIFYPNCGAKMDE